MPKHRIAVVLLADTTTPGDMGRMANAFTTAREFAEAGDEVRFIFDGAGVKWVHDPSAARLRLDWRGGRFRFCQEGVSLARTRARTRVGVRICSENGPSRYGLPADRGRSMDWGGHEGYFGTRS